MAGGVRRPRRRTFAQQIIFNEEYARANAPARISFFGEGLFAPTLIQFGTDEQKRRFLPKIQSVEELWCQGFSEPNAGSDLANIQTRAVLDGDEWVITGQKVWTTLAHRADWCFVVCRTDPESTSHHGLSYLLVPDGPARHRGAPAAPDDRQRGVQRGVLRRCAHREGERARPGRRRLEGRDGDARLRARHRVPVAAARVRAASSASCSTSAHKRGAATDPVLRDELASRYIGLQVMRFNGMRMLTCMLKNGTLGPEASIGKLFWTSWHRRFGETAMDVLGADALARRPRRSAASTSSTSCTASSWRAARRRSTPARARSNDNIIGERVLGLPREPR